MFIFLVVRECEIVVLQQQKVSGYRRKIRTPVILLMGHRGVAVALVEHESSARSRELLNSLSPSSFWFHVEFGMHQ